jgi:two-component system response regulator FlrC
MGRLQGWRWPGNLRELENVIERAVLITKDSVINGDSIRFEAESFGLDMDFVPGMSLSEVEKRLILQTLELTAQNRTRAAQVLGISIRTLRNKLNEYREEGVV